MKEKNYSIFCSIQFEFRIQKFPTYLPREHYGKCLNIALNSQILHLQIYNFFMSLIYIQQPFWAKKNYHTIYTFWTLTIYILQCRPNLQLRIITLLWVQNRCHACDACWPREGNFNRGKPTGRTFCLERL